MQAQDGHIHLVPKNHHATGKGRAEGGPEQGPLLLGRKEVFLNCIVYLFNNNCYGTV